MELSFGMKYLKPLDDWLGKNPLPRNAMTDSSAIHLGVTLGLANISREQAMQIAQCSSMYFAIIKHDLKNTRAVRRYKEKVYVESCMKVFDFMISESLVSDEPLFGIVKLDDVRKYDFGKQEEE